MSITWKKGSQFKPEILLNKIAADRTVSPEGGVSFSGFELEDCLPAIKSMLSFPSVTTDLDTSNLVWKGLARVTNELTKESFIKAINSELTEKLATKEEIYFLLTSISINHQDIPKKLKILDAELTFYAKSYPLRFKSRNDLLKSWNVPVASDPDSYCRVVIKVKAKTTEAAVNRALRALDLQRAIWCMMSNPQMQLISFSSSSPRPINVIRLGSKHTLHLESGAPAKNNIWYEPGFVEVGIHRIKNPDIAKHNVRVAIRGLSNSNYADKLVTALLRYVRALDESEANTAFLRLWAALESLVSPEVADYDKLIARCAFLFQDVDFHRQLLVHLLEYRNRNVHAGEESEKARTHCFQLQLYFVNLIWFHLNNAKFFKSLNEVNSFLELPPSKPDLERRLELTKRAIKFIR